MKTAISLPDELGHAAELYAMQHDVSRSELYAKALAEYLSRHKYEDLTERINATLSKIGVKATDEPGEMGLSSIRGLEW
jgi:hypothetical protein